MTDAYFKENNKFLGLSGIINRRNFIVNFLILEIIEALILTTPLLYLLFTNPDMMLDFFRIFGDVHSQDAAAAAGRADYAAEHTDSG